MRKAWRLCVAMVVLALGTGCTGSIMTTVKSSDSPPAGDQALVTFLRPPGYGWDVAPAIWDGENLVGTHEVKSYIQYRTTPGEHLFIARALNWTYVKATLEAGKRYFILTRVWGGFGPGVALDPMTRSEAEKPNWDKLEGWLRDLTPMGAQEQKVAEYSRAKLPEVRQAIEDFRAGKVKYGILEASDGR